MYSAGSVAAVGARRASVLQQVPRPPRPLHPLREHRGDRIALRVHTPLVNLRDNLLHPGRCCRGLECGGDVGDGRYGAANSIRWCVGGLFLPGDHADWAIPISVGQISLADRRHEAFCESDAHAIEGA